MSDAKPGREFRRLFARPGLRSLAGGRSFERGLLYAANGRVGKRTATESSVTAKVRGSASYKVRLWVEDEEPASECTCPMGMSGQFCKHAVAVALVVTEAEEAGGQSDEAPVDLRDYLSTLDPNTLVNLLLERAEEDDLFDARLRMDAARAVAGPPQTSTFKRAIDEAFITNDFVDYREMYSYANNVHAVVETLRELLDDGHAAAVIELTEHALDRADDAVGYVDDSDGYMRGIGEDLQALHHDACLASPPDRVDLARRLYDRERHSGDLEIFYGAAATYADVLGEEGLAEYRRLAHAEWDALPALKPGDKRGDDSGRFRITSIMETLAALTGDVDAVVAVLAKDQSSPYQFLRIFERYRDAGRNADALSWLEKGLELFGTRDVRLVDAAAEEYHRTGRGADAVQLCWRTYEPAPSPGGYRRLCDNAKKAESWLDWRDRALGVLRKKVETAIAAAAKPTRGQPGWTSPYSPRADASDLVDVFLFEQDADQAWAEAQTGGCSTRLWLELATLRENDYPTDAIPIWQAEVERSIDAKNNSAYENAVQVMARIRRLMIAAGQDDAFAPYAAKIRTAHKPKRNLMKLLDQRGW